MSEFKDWRGTPITIGAPVIYGGPVGRSIQLVEGTVEGFTKAGRVNVRIVRRSYSTAWSGDKQVVHVGADRLVVLNPDSLPATELPTWGEAVEQAKAKSKAMDRIRKTHTGPDWGIMKTPWVNQWTGATEIRERSGTLPCTVCGDENRTQRECPGEVG